MTQTNAFRDPSRVNQLIKCIQTEAAPIAERLGRPIQIMEVCGGHTHAIVNTGINQLLPSSIELIHGPGCPVCVLPTTAIDQAVSLAESSNHILASFGDPLRVPGSRHSLLDAKANGAHIQTLYSPLDALKLAKHHPNKTIIFFAIGFDTTIPSTACTLQMAAQQSITNFRVLCHHICLMPVLTTLLERQEIQLDGFLGPGHVSMVIGAKAYASIADKYHKPLVIAGFEPVDILHALYLLVQQLSAQQHSIQNAYSRVVLEEGNKAAQQSINDVFISGIDAKWRGLDLVPGSGLSIRPKYQQHDAVQLLNSQHVAENNTDPVYCKQVLTGSLKPHHCPWFGKQCTPHHPQSGLMVSTEGACAAYYASHAKTAVGTLS
ncbi:hydrogenase formation protein HypD [Zooshikella harenae]|uniref:Hydrogenase maturation factor n=1 Tax=Zooshikella harenae TaxID=2827238 RepID=A0ABS5ZE98_9GAMM|nr:hydrogenase formation protein HypD [Zooshikella harenae]MBU2712310.1 hydrogenase formation protein HypD [Zooshikella harenae]